jgi:hypothetical protein
MGKGIRKNITVPGLLAPALRLRFHEFGFRTLSPFAVDLVSYDLQSGAKHTITVAIARDTLAAQDAVDAEIVARYQPGQPREGLLVQVVERLNELRTMARNSPPPPLNAKPERITFPVRIWKLVDLRWEELGYASLSAYVTGLVRYDLLIGGPHRSQKPDTRRAAQDAFARVTVARRKSGVRRKLYLDHLIERAEGRPLDETELEKIKAKIAHHLRTALLRP